MLCSESVATAAGYCCCSSFKSYHSCSPALFHAAGTMPVCKKQLHVAAFLLQMLAFLLASHDCLLARSMQSF